jgi:hypothetical protein
MNIELLKSDEMGYAGNKPGDGIYDATARGNPDVADR